MENKDDLASLLPAAKSGDQDAFSELYTLFFKRIYTFIFFRVNSQSVAEDLAEETFVKAYQGLPRFRGAPEAFTGWLFQVARNLVIDHYRARRETVALEDVESFLPFHDHTVERLDADTGSAALLKLLEQLTVQEQRVIKLRFLEDLSTAETAGALNISEGSVRVIQHRALKHLKELSKQLPRESN